MPYKDPERRREHNRAWLQNNKELIKTKKHQYYLENREKINQKIMEWRTKNIRRYLISRQIYRLNVRQPIRFLRHHGVEGEIPKSLIEVVKESQINRRLINARRSI